MAFWLNKPNTYKYRGFIDIPEGRHRVRICKVEVEELKYNRKCFKITMEVSGYHGKLWHHLWYDPSMKSDLTKRVYPFLNSFEIDDPDLSHYENWIGADGAVIVRYKYRERAADANYLQFLSGEQKNMLPPWKDVTLDTRVAMF